MKFLVYAALASATLIKRQGIPQTVTVPGLCSNGNAGSATIQIVNLDQGLELYASGSSFSTTCPAASSSSSVSSTSSVNSTAVLRKRQLPAGSVVNVNSFRCGGTGQSFDLTTGIFTFSFCPVLSIFVSTPTFAGCVDSTILPFSGVCPSGVSSSSSAASTTTTTTGVNVNVNVDVNVNVVIGNPNCQACGAYTYYYYSACPCQSKNYVFTTFGLAYTCGVESYVLVTRPYVCTGAQVVTIQVPSVASTAVVPVTVTTVQGQVATVPAKTLTQVVVQPPPSPPPASVTQQAVTVQSAPVAFTGAANKAGFGVIAAIAGAAALL